MILHDPKLNRSLLLVTPFILTKIHNITMQPYSSQPFQYFQFS